jgi:type IV secretion system protein TrbI
VRREPPEGHASSALNARDEANRQDEKLDFLEVMGASDEVLMSFRKRPHSDFSLMAGTIIPGVLLSGLNSDLPGQILGQVSQNVFDTATGRYLLVPQGTKVIGRYDSRVSYGQERLLIVWNRLVFPDATSISFDTMPGVDLTGQAGLSDRVNNHYLRLFSGALLSSVLGAGAQVANGPNYQTADPAFGQLALQGIAKNIIEVGQEITRKNLNIQPTLEVRPGFRFNIFVNKDMALEPYRN